MAPSVNVVNVKFNVAKVRSWVNRLPFFTRITFLVILGFWLLSLLLPWISSWAALVPGEVDIWHMYRLNTFPFAHTGFLHTLLGLIALIPLLERFESEHGTLVSLALFAGPFATLPGGVYILVDHIVLRKNTSVQGAGVWIFLLLSCEAIKTHRANPSFRLDQYRLPVWPYPLLILLLLHYLLPGTLSMTDSLLANTSGAAIGYLFELSYLKFLIPPEKVLRFIEGKLNLLGRLPRYVSVDQKTYGRYGVLPTTNSLSADVLGGDPATRTRTPIRSFAVAGSHSQ